MNKYILQVTTTWAGRVAVSIYNTDNLLTITRTFCMKEELKLLEAYLSVYGFTLEDAYLSQQQMEAQTWHGSVVTTLKEKQSLKDLGMIAYLKKGFTRLSSAIANIIRETIKSITP